MLVTSNTQVSLTTKFAFPKFSLQTCDDVIAMFSIKAPELPTTTKRAPLRLIAVVDRSGSMQGSKIDLVRKTLMFAASQLSAQDELCIVIFDDTVSTLVSLSKMTSANKTNAINLIKTINDGGSTNLSGGLLAGVDEIKKASPGNESVTTAMIVFTDGQANAGITGNDAICNALEANMRGVSPTTIFTFGFGSDHDDVLLQRICAVGSPGGMYSFINTPDDIPKYLVNCLGTLLSVVAQNISVNISPMNGVVIKEILTKFPVNRLESGVFTVRFGDLYSGLGNDILMKLQLPSVSEANPSFQSFSCIATGFNVLSSSIFEVVSIGTVGRSEEIIDTVNELMDADVVPHITRYLAVLALEEAQASAEKSDFSGGCKKLRDARAAISGICEKQNSNCSSDELLLDLQETEKNMKTETMYRQVGSKFSSSRIQSNAYQRQGEHAKYNGTPMIAKLSSNYTSMFKK